MFVRALVPVGVKLQQLRREKEAEIKQGREEMEQTDGGSIVHSVRLCGVSFAQALNDVMEGYQRAEESTRFDLEAELNHFHDQNPEFDLSAFLPFDSLEEYVTWLSQEDVIADVEVPLNGGAQYRRMMKECVVATLFATLDRADRGDVIQARGERRLSLSWDEVVVKMLSAGQEPIELRILYAAARIRHFYASQKDVIRDYMRSFAEAHERRPGPSMAATHQHGSGLVSGAFRLMEKNHIVRGLVLGAFDQAAERQMEIFSTTLIQLSKSLLANPWLYLQSSTASVWDGGSDDPTNDWWTAPHRDMQFLKGLIPNKVKHRQQLAKFLNDRMKEIPSNEEEQEDAIRKVIATVQHVYDLVQTQVADQISHVAETFYKVPMMRQMETDMVSIVLPDDIDSEVRDHRTDLTKTLEEEAQVLQSIIEVIARHNSVKNRVLNSAPASSADPSIGIEGYSNCPPVVGPSDAYGSGASGQAAWDEMVMPPPTARGSNPYGSGTAPISHQPSGEMPMMGNPQTVPPMSARTTTPPAGPPGSGYRAGSGFAPQQVQPQMQQQPQSAAQQPQAAPQQSQSAAKTGGILSGLAGDGGIFGRSKSPRNAGKSPRSTTPRTPRGFASARSRADSQQSDQAQQQQQQQQQQQYQQPQSQQSQPYQQMQGQQQGGYEQPMPSARRWN
eukprot:Filipodium_phascolosomae@DN1929_c0_g1_i1.p1